MVATYWPVDENETPTIARLWSPWIWQSICSAPLESAREDQIRIFGSFPICPVTTVVLFGCKSRACAHVSIA